MARPRLFDESEVLATVMNAFWRHGYTASTTRSLEEVSGVGIRSLANTFGDKENLLIKALACYREASAEHIVAAFNPPSVAAIITYIEDLSAPIDPDHPRNAGCFMVNTVSELEDPPDQVAQEIELFFELWRATFQQALDNDNITDSRARSEFLLGSVWGALGLIRLAGDTTAAKPMTSIITQTVHSWTKTD
jgi:TetR/AcrR family transcriptional repressor of nem operon